MSGVRDREHRGGSSYAARVLECECESVCIGGTRSVQARYAMRVFRRVRVQMRNLGACVRMAGAVLYYYKDKNSCVSDILLLCTAITAKQRREYRYMH